MKAGTRPDQTETDRQYTKDSEQAKSSGASPEEEAEDIETGVSGGEFSFQSEARSGKEEFLAKLDFSSDDSSEEEERRDGTGNGARNKKERTRIKPERVEIEEQVEANDLENEDIFLFTYVHLLNKI